MMIHLIRHGKTQANAQKRYCGQTDLPLSDEGIAELKNRKVPPAEAFFTSGMLRARQTLVLLYGEVDSLSISALSEYHFGDFEMHTYEELKDDPAYMAWIADELGQVSCPGGESKSQYEQRVLKGFATLLETHFSSAALVAHGGTIVTIMAHLFPGQKNFYEWQPHPGTGYTLFRNHEGLYTYQPIEGGNKA